MQHSRAAALETLREGYREDIALGDAMQRLIASEDFEKVFTEHLFKDYLVHLGMQKGNPNAQNEAQQADFDASISAISRMSFILKRVVQKGIEAPQKLLEVDAAEQDFLNESQE